MTTSPVMGWLAEGLPITLLCDLVTTREPESQTINLNERPPGDDDFLLADHAVVAHSAAAIRAASA